MAYAKQKVVGDCRLQKDTKAFTLGVTLNVPGSKNFEILPSGKAADMRIVPSRVNQELGMDLWNLLKEEAAKLDYEFSSAQINLNFPGKAHRDRNNSNFQWCCSLGDFQGGRLCWQESKITYERNTRGMWQKMDGRHLHWVEPYEGKRYSIVLFDNMSHPAKPVFWQT